MASAAGAGAASGGAEKVAIIGSGNWGSAIARIVGENVKALDNVDTTVQMWVFEEEVEGKKLTEIINTTHENVKYLPGFKFPTNVVANPSLADTVKDATLLIFVLPHQFLPRLFPQILPNMAAGARAISLIKGIDYDDKGLVLISDNIRRALSIECAVLMGANVAKEVAKGDFAEATIGCKDAKTATVWKSLFHTPTFMIETVDDESAVELCGALKNIVAIGAGFVDGLGWGGNTKAAVMRIGLKEMMKFAKKFYKGCDDFTFFESCGVADLITTCFGGRNRKCAEAFVTSGKSWEDIEKEILGGQKLQGTLTAAEVNKVLTMAKATAEFPLFTRIYEIAYKGAKPETVVQFS